MKLHSLTGRLFALMLLGSGSGIALAGTAARSAPAVDGDPIAVTAQKGVVPATGTVLQVAAQPVGATLSQSDLCNSNLNDLNSDGARGTVGVIDDHYRFRNGASNFDRHYVRHHYFW